MSRTHLLSNAIEHLPLAYSYIKSSYDEASFLVRQNDTILSAEGVQQGDPLGPLLFCIAIQHIVDNLKSPLNCWYLDDGTIGGNAQALAQDFQYVVNESVKIGSCVNVANTEIYQREESLTSHFSSDDFNMKILDDQSRYLRGGLADT